MKCFLFKKLDHNFFVGGITVLYIPVPIHAVPVSDAAVAPASSSLPSITTQTPEKPSPHVLGMYYACIKLSK